MIRAAIVGSGFAARLHTEALRKCGAEPYLVLAAHEESARRFAASFGIPHYAAADAGYTELADPVIDTVHICTPPTYHAEAVRAALSFGKRVLCEKPLAMTEAEAAAICRLAENAEMGRAAEKDSFRPAQAGGTPEAARTALVLNVRYHMAVRRAREILRSGALGRPLLIHGSYLQEFHALPAAYDWRYDPKTGGDLRAVTEIGTHWFDAVTYVTGKRIRAVLAATENFMPVRPMLMPDGTEKEVAVASEDAAQILLSFEDGASGAVVLSEVSPGRGNRLSFEITCEKGNLWWNEEENNCLHTAKKGEGIRTEVFAFGNGFGDTFEALVREFYTGAGPDGTPGGMLPSFADGRYLSAVCDAVRESAGKGSCWVSVKEREEQEDDGI